MYKERRRVLDGENMRESIYGMIDSVVEKIIMGYIGEEASSEEWDMKSLKEALAQKIPIKTSEIELTEEEKENSDKEAFIARMKEKARDCYEAKEKEFDEIDPNMIRDLERIFLLKIIDRKWMDHIDDMEQLRQGIGLQAYGNKDPLVQYRFLGFEMFEEMTSNIQKDTVGALMHVKLEQKVEKEEAPKITGTNKDDTVAKGPYVRKTAKIGRNDPCPCGSGKKYKQCCGRNK